LGCQLLYSRSDDCKHGQPNPKTSIGTSPSTSIKVKKTYGDILPEHDRLFSLLPHLVFIFLKGQKKRK